MLHDCLGDKQGKLPNRDQPCEQEGVFSPGGGRIERKLFAFVVSNCETRGIQVSDSTVGLKCLILNGHESQLLGSPDQPRAIAHQVQLKARLLRRAYDG
jgi:hypothetical protein